MPGPYDAGNSITSGSPLGQQPTLAPTPAGPSGPRPNAYPGVEQMMGDPRFKQYVQQSVQNRSKNRRATLQDMLNGQGTIQELASVFPKLQQIQEKKKLDDAKEKVMSIQFDGLYKRAENAAQQQQQQAQTQQGAG